MDKNAGTALIDELYSTIKEKIQLKNYSQIQSNLNQIAKIEEKFIQSYTRRKKEGGYYTAENITNFIIIHVLIELINKRFDIFNINTIKDLDSLNLEVRRKVVLLLSDMTICDPSCGSGAFLVNAAKKVTKLLIKLGEKKDFDENIHIVLKNIKGYDLNESAIKLCRLKLYKWFFETNSNGSYLKSAFKLIEDNIQIKDSLTSPISQKSDIIIGNPPYGNILDQHQRIILKKKGIFHKEIYCAFLLKALEWSNGIIGFLVPKSFMLRQNYIDFRALLIEKVNLLRIYDVGPNIFKSATNEVQILIYERKSGNNKNLEVYNNSGSKMLTYSNQKFDSLKVCKNQDCSLNDTSKKIYVYSFNKYCPYCNFKNEPINRIRIKLTPPMLNLINKIEQNGNLNYLNVRDFPKLIRGEEDKGLRAIKAKIQNHIQGSCIFLNAKNDFMHYHYQGKKSFDIEKIDPKKLKGNNYEYYIKPKLLIKHNNTYPVAVYTEENVCFTSSIYSLLHEDKNELKFLCALLNSSLIKFYCIYGINNQINTTINLNQYMIRHLPIPDTNNKIKSTLIANVDLIMDFYKHPQQNKPQIMELQGKIDNTIFQLYLCTNEEISLILKNILG